MKYLLFSAFLAFSFFAQAQTNPQLQQAEALLKQFKEPEALVIYQNLATQEPKNVALLVKCAELNSSIGEREPDKYTKTNLFEAAKSFADKAILADSNNADAWYAQALAYGKMSQVEADNKKIIEDVRQIKLCANRALAINPNHAKANYIAGKWHYEMLALSWYKKAAIKTFYGKGMPKPDIDSALAYMEKSKTLEPYFVLNYLDLAKAYGFNNQPAKEIEVLQKMVKLPTRTADDASLKEQGKKLLDSIQ